MKNQKTNDQRPRFYKQMGVFHGIFDETLVDYIELGR